MYISLCIQIVTLKSMLLLACLYKAQQMVGFKFKGRNVERHICALALSVEKRVLIEG